MDYIAKIGDIVNLGCGTGDRACRICGSAEYKVIQILTADSSPTRQIVEVAPIHQPDCEVSGPHCKTCNCGGMAHVKLEQAYCQWFVRNDGGRQLLCGVIRS